MTARTVTVTRKTPPDAGGIITARYVVTFSQLPDRTFGPWSFIETKRDLMVSTRLSPPEVRGLVMDAHVNGSATMPVDR